MELPELSGIQFSVKVGRRQRFRKFGSIRRVGFENLGRTIIEKVGFLKADFCDQDGPYGDKSLMDWLLVEVTLIAGKVNSISIALRLSEALQKHKTVKTAWLRFAPYAHSMC